MSMPSLPTPTSIIGRLIETPRRESPIGVKRKLHLDSPTPKVIRPLAIVTQKYEICVGEGVDNKAMLCDYEFEGKKYFGVLIQDDKKKHFNNITSWNHSNITKNH